MRGRADRFQKGEGPPSPTFGGTKRAEYSAHTHPHGMGIRTKYIYNVWKYAFAPHCYTCDISFRGARRGIKCHPGVRVYVLWDGRAEHNLYYRTLTRTNVYPFLLPASYKNGQLLSMLLYIVMSSIQAFSLAPVVGRPLQTDYYKE